MKRTRWCVDVFGWRFGFERSRITHRGDTYMDRWILYCGGTLRLHKIYRGDADRALHDHPWWFVTFPLSAYSEEYWSPPGYMVRVVRPWRLHFRERTFRHRILGDGAWPVWTFVISGRYRARDDAPHGWGFYPTPDTFVPFSYERTHYDDPPDR